MNLDGFGSSVAIWEEGAPGPTRPLVRPGADEPTLLFTAHSGVELAAAALIDGDYVYAFLSSGDLHRCGLSRVRAGEVTDPSAWRFWAGSGEWSTDPDEIKELFFGSSILDVHWNPHIERWLAVYSTPKGDGIDVCGRHRS